jgi:cellulose synthase/poly-beta-1,6-N-acetylglucosamine synthase-like glycosyltransferase
LCERKAKPSLNPPQAFRIAVENEFGTHFVIGIVIILLAPFAVLTAFFVVELIAGLPTSRFRRAGSKRVSAVVIVPAHDEALVIGHTVAALTSALPEGVRLLVVADNCSDTTAGIARSAGAEVIERNEADQRGKGHALAFAAEHLASDPPDVLAVLDADCRMDSPSLLALVSAAGSGSPVQAVNLLRPDKASSPLVQISTFAFMLKNLVRQRGLQRIAGRVHLTGTGMAMPYALFSASGKVRSSIVEDLAHGLELAESGHHPELVADATVWSCASTEEGTLTQRRRWEGGFLATSLRQAPKLILKSVVKGDVRGVLAGLDLLVPPLALFALLNVAALAIASLLSLAFKLDWWPVLLQLGLLVVALLAIFVVWLREGRQFISLGVLARLPLYAMWKVPMYLGLAKRGAPGDWLRTGR